MAVSFDRVVLDLDPGDSDGRLVYSGGVLLAVVARLGAIHGELAGRWFVEALFTARLTDTPETFADLAELERWIAGSPA